MTTAITERPANGIVITPEEITLIRTTVANGATDAELKLFFYDCTRRGVHPLDKLIHFTKRGGKYTPITSIDFMRGRAHDTGECAGISDPEHAGEAKKDGFTARVVVKRIVQGHLCDFAATARWEEYCPARGSDHMWQKMPHTMLGKCAEALALRKAFPQQLSGLYAREEMDQAAGNGASEAPRDVDTVTGEIMPPTAPAGYDDWCDDLAAVADTGSDALKAAWTKSKPELRRYLTTHNPAGWENLKARAEKFGRQVPA